MLPMQYFLFQSTLRALCFLFAVSKRSQQLLPLRYSVMLLLLLLLLMLPATCCWLIAAVASSLRIFVFLLFGTIVAWLGLNCYQTLNDLQLSIELLPDKSCLRLPLATSTRVKSAAATATATETLTEYLKQII